jgi:hypothetical protein
MRVISMPCSKLIDGRMVGMRLASMVFAGSCDKKHVVTASHPDLNRTLGMISVDK